MRLSKISGSPFLFGPLPGDQTSGGRRRRSRRHPDFGWSALGVTPFWACALEGQRSRVVTSPEIVFNENRPYDAIERKQLNRFATVFLVRHAKDLRGKTGVDPSVGVVSRRLRVLRARSLNGGGRTHGRSKREQKNVCWAHLNRVILHNAP